MLSSANVRAAARCSRQDSRQRRLRGFGLTGSIVLAVVLFSAGSGQAKQLYVGELSAISPDEFNTEFVMGVFFKKTAAPLKDDQGHDIPIGSRIIPFVDPSCDVKTEPTCTPYDILKILYIPPDKNDPIAYTVAAPPGLPGEVVAYDVSPNLTAVGFETYDPGENAFVWTPSAGLHVIGQGQAKAVDADGTVVAGRGDFTVDHSPISEAFRWTDALGMVNIGALAHGVFSEATAISDDGTILAGNSIVVRSTSHAFRWTLTDQATSAGTMLDLGSLGGPGAFSEADGIGATATLLSAVPRSTAEIL